VTARRPKVGLLRPLIAAREQRRRGVMGAVLEHPNVATSSHKMTRGGVGGDAANDRHYGGFPRQRIGAGHRRRGGG